MKTISSESLSKESTEALKGDYKSILKIINWHLINSGIYYDSLGISEANKREYLSTALAWMYFGESLGYDIVITTNNSLIDSSVLKYSPHNKKYIERLLKTEDNNYLNLSKEMAANLLKQFSEKKNEA